MHLEDELFDVLVLSRAETQQLWVSGGSSSEHQGWRQEAWAEQEGKSSQGRVGCAEWATDTPPPTPHSVPCSPAPTYQSLCLELQTPCHLGPWQGCAWPSGVGTPLTIQGVYLRREYSLVKGSGWSQRTALEESRLSHGPATL